MLGHPGSGKSYFTRQLAPIIGAVRLNGDHMRTAMFTDPKDIANRDNNPKVFGAIDYAVYEVLRAGHSVLYDAMHNKHADRLRHEAAAKELGAPTVLVWVKTPYEVALKRGVERPEQPDQRRKSEEQMKQSLDFFIAALEQPKPGERTIVIDGMKPFEEQYESFTRQLSDLHV